jgi:hypothetical protein
LAKCALGTRFAIVTQTADPRATEKLAAPEPLGEPLEILDRDESQRLHKPFLEMRLLHRGNRRLMHHER